MKFFAKLLIKPLYKPLQNLFRFTLRHPKYRWLIILGSLLYVVSPIDIAPDTIPVLGWLDDGLIATLLVTEVSQVLMTHLKSKRSGSDTASEPAAEQTVEVKAA
jgi:uncharacterized membrane protein YkvA (DUF1232 family)